jgi:MFS family permease
MVNVIRNTVVPVLAMRRDSKYSKKEGPMLKKVHLWFASFDPTVWWIVSATGITKITQFMVIPFVALYMTVHTHASPATIGLAVGMNAATGMVFGFVGGWLSDKYGRKALMIVAMLVNVVAMVGFANARLVWFFFLMSAMSGITRSLFGPTSRAMLGDVTPDERRGVVFSMNYWFLNLGAALGPILGGYLGTVSTGWTFYLAALVSLVYAVIIYALFPESRPSEGALQRELTFVSTLKTVLVDRVLLLFLFAGFLEMFCYAQIDSTLPQLLGMKMGATEGGKLFSIVLASNAIEVVLVQAVVSKIGDRLGVLRALIVGQILFGIGYTGLAFSSSLLSFIGSILVLTLGEMLTLPPKSIFITRISGERLRSTYFGANNLSKFGLFLGPWLGGIILDAAGGTALFMSVGLIALLAIPFYVLSYYVYLRNDDKLQSP